MRVMTDECGGALIAGRKGNPISDSFTFATSASRYGTTLLSPPYRMLLFVVNWAIGPNWVCLRPLGCSF